jgi:stage V sporulation protein AF
MKQAKPAVKKLAENLDFIKEKLGYGVTFDLLVREITVGGKRAALVFLDGFVNDNAVIEIMKRLLDVPRGGLAVNAAEHVLHDYLPFFEVSWVEDLNEACNEVLAGPMLLLIDGLAKIFVVDVRQYQVRSIEEPDLERVTRGSREGFVETGLFNVNLIRRRVRDPNLRFEVLTVGERSQTDIMVGYIADIASPEIVAEVKERISHIDRDAIPMGGKNLEEYILGTKLNPLPVTRYTERPDVAAAHLYEGHVIIIVDTTPFALIVPSTLWHFTQHAEEYFQNPPVGTYLRWVRTLGIFLSLVLIPVWYLLATSSSLPEWINFIGPKEPGRVPLWLQFLMLEIGLDLLRMALVHTPNALATSLGLVGAILLGELAIETGLFTSEAILYTALVAVGTFATPSLEFSLAIRLFRYFLFLGSVLFRWWGLGGAFLISILIMGLTKSFGVPYLWPLIPFDWPALLRIIFRYPIPNVSIWPWTMPWI